MPEIVTPPDPAAAIAALGGDAVIGASVDVGANSVHLLVAAVDGHRLAPIVDESVFLGLGDRVARHGYLGPAVRSELVAALARYAEAARAFGAREITFLGTEPVRRAADGAAIVREVETATGIALHVLDHREEAVLNLLGVTMGRPIASDIVVLDIGGGSSEVAIIGPSHPLEAHGIPIGSARLTQQFVVADPPTPAEIEAMAADARRIVSQAPAARPAELVAVGGTASNLIRVLPAAALDRTLSRRRITVALAMLTVEPSALAATRHLLNPTRARILPAGAVIVQAILEHYGADRIRVSEEGIREGAVLAAAHAGRAWRDSLRDLACGWR